MDTAPLQRFMLEASSSKNKNFSKHQAPRVSVWAGELLSINHISETSSARRTNLSSSFPPLQKGRSASNEKSQANSTDLFHVVAAKCLQSPAVCSSYLISLAEWKPPGWRGRVVKHKVHFHLSAARRWKCRCMLASGGISLDRAEAFWWRALCVRKQSQLSSAHVFSRVSLCRGMTPLLRRIDAYVWKREFIK